MTVRDLGASMLRRWYVVALALLLAGAGNYVLQRDRGVYTTETVVAFVLPNQTRLSSNSGLDDSSVIAFAGAVAREVNGGRDAVSYSTDDAPLYGAGIRQGALIAIPNSGSQFVSVYQRAEVVLQIVGPTREWVARKQSELLGGVLDAAEAQQASVTSPAARIQTTPVPLSTQISHVVPSNSVVLAAFVALFVSALIVGGWSATAVDRAAQRARDKRARRAAPPTSHEGIDA